eukprot:CAMPEP_0172454432 /NCGR_PEP_ID=MMETSP1065-20121228/11422_1 /TAXON_ID=265537 /ORGANISM="Amphiprora paludosa, Strain CCMP125" /LENGTH=288 /DNA_ID=CAMNT_0013206759 /DNA_START=417 /DNA_END=1283 /DNA_ORIENTATION=+
MHQSTPQMNYEWKTSGDGNDQATEDDTHNELTSQPQTADMNVRRSISDSVLQRGCPTVYNRKNTAYMLMSRSGGPTVKQMIATILSRCEQVKAATAAANQQQQEDGSASSKPAVTIPSPPTAECSVLSQFAGDAYYNVVIAGRQGIPALIQAMETWPQERGLQECCCLALGNLCCSQGKSGSGGTGSNLVAIEQAGGIPAIIQAMRNHSTSVAVQSAACDALRNMSGLIVNIIQNVREEVPSKPTTSAEQLQELEEALQHATQMYLMPLHHRIAETLLRLVQTSTQRL